MHAGTQTWEYRCLWRDRQPLVHLNAVGLDPTVLQYARPHFDVCGVYVPVRVRVGDAEDRFAAARAKVQGGIMEQ